MPYVNIKVTKEGVTASLKAELIKGLTDLLAKVLAKNWGSNLRLTLVEKCQRSNVDLTLNSQFQKTKEISVGMGGITSRGTNGQLEVGYEWRKPL